MMKPGENTLFPLIHDYLKAYLPKRRSVSRNTIRSYRKALEGLLDYTREYEQVPLGQMAFEHLTIDAIFFFLKYLQTEKGYSTSTCNARFATIRAFMDYAADHDVTLAAELNKLKRIPFRELDDTTATVEYMGMAAIIAIIRQPSATTSKGPHDRFFIVLLYDAGARVQEMLNIRLSDIQLGPLPRATLFRKRRKTRVAPLMEKTAQHLKKHLLESYADTALEQDVTLFCSAIRGEKHPLTSRAAQYIFQKYGEQARQVCKEIPPNVRPHLFRHNRTIHLYQEGMNLTLISQWLGHSQLKTTQIYAHADTEHKRRTIEVSTPQDNPLYSKLNSARHTVTNEEILKELVDLR